MKNSNIKKILAAITSAAIVVSAAATWVNAEPDLSGGEAASSGYETTVPEDETTAPGNETTAPGEETTAPGDETTVPGEETPAPSDETTVPGEETTVPGDETTVPGEETTAPPAPENGAAALPLPSDAEPADYGIMPIADDFINVSEFGDEVFQTYLRNHHSSGGLITISSVLKIDINGTDEDGIYAGITKLEGIEKLTALQDLICNRTALGNFILDGHQKLENITLDNSVQLETVNVSGCPKLKYIHISIGDPTIENGGENLKSVTLENLPALDTLNVYNYHFNDFGKFHFDPITAKALEALYVGTTEIKTLDTRPFENLTTLSCYNNHIVSLDLSKNTQLTNFDAHNNTYDMGVIKDGADFLAKLTAYDKNFSVDNVISWGPNANYEDGTLTIERGANSIQYTYKCREGGNGGTLTFQPTINFKMIEHEGRDHIDIENDNADVKFDKDLVYLESKGLLKVDNNNSNVIILDSGDYYLSDHLDLGGKTITINANSTVNLCLNGYELKASAINVYGGTLSIFDCKGKNDERDKDGCILLRTNINVKDNSTLNLYAGNIEHNVDGSDTNGVILGYNILNDNFNNYFNMYGGRISGFSNGVSFIYNSYYSNYTNSFCMFGGEISRNNNNGVYVNGSRNPLNGTYSGKFEMSGGRITGNGGNSTNDDRNNNGVYVSGSQFTMSGGEISGNNNNGVSVNGGKFTMDNGEISQNKNNGVLFSSGTFTMINGKIIKNAECGINANTDFDFVSGTISESKIGISASYGNNIRMSGGTISACTTGLEINSGRLNMYSGTITGNTTGALLNNGTFFMTAGEITGNDKGVDFGANSSATFEVTEEPVIFGNNTSGKEVNVYLPQGQYIRILNGVRGVAKIGFTTEEKPTVIPSKEKVYAAKHPYSSYVSDTNLYFISDDKNYESKSNETEPYDVYIEAPKGFLTVTNTVTGNGNINQNFPFELSLDDTSITGTVQDDKGNNIAFAAGKTTFDLKHGESITIPLPAGIGYTVEETESYGHIAIPTNYDGKIVQNGTNTAAFTNYMGPSGTLTVSKTVTGTGGDQTKPFTFNVSYSMDGEENTVKFTLKHGEHRDIRLPAEAVYTVTESDNEGYTVTRTGETGTIIKDQTSTAAFTNHKDKLGNLTVSKTVTGTGGDQTKPFTFTVKLTDGSGSPVSGTFGDVEFNADGTATFTLKHGESIAATRLPAGITYTVTEEDPGSDYTVSKSGASGTIEEDGSHNAVFVNTYAPKGSLTVVKTVTGIGGDTTKPFTFTVKLTDGSGSPVSGIFGDVEFNADGTATFTLKHGESKTFTGIPEGVKYTVSESGNEGYTVTKTGETDTISKDKAAAAVFTNHKNNAQEPAPGDNDQDPTPTPPTGSDNTGNYENPGYSGNHGDTNEGEDVSHGAGIFADGELLKTAPRVGIAAVVSIIAVLAAILRKRSRTDR